ncbi:MAG: ATP-binding protein [Polyangiaceae bacterium]|nr:ATP-binding protein [Polyangiaceae bacterium]
MIRLRVPGSVTYRHLAVRVISAACKMTSPGGAEMAGDGRGGAGSGPGDERADEFEAQTVSAFGEAFNNIAIHGYRGGPPGDVDIEIESDEEGIEIRLMDTGKSFDPADVAPPDMEALPESGMGLFIIRSFMDEVEYRAGSPNVLRLAKRREAPAHALDSASEGAPASDPAPSSSGGGGEQEDLGDGFAERAADDRASGQSGIRMRSVARTGEKRAAGGIKIQ